MGRNVAIGIQDFEDVIKNDCFYVDKTSFIKEWWENGDSVTLITRPRRFGKTLNMSMLNRFFLFNTQEREIFLKVFLSGRRRNIENYKEPILSLIFRLQM